MIIIHYNYIAAYLELWHVIPEAYSKPCQIYKMMRHIETLKYWADVQQDKFSWEKLPL